MFKKIDLESQDIFILLGLAGLGYGLNEVYGLGWAFIILGGLLTLMGLFGVKK